jgi:hypothetical protein
MTKKEFIKKYSIELPRGVVIEYSQSEINKLEKLLDDECERDLNSVIKDELHKFVEYVNSNHITTLTEYLAEEIVESYLSQSK